MIIDEGLREYATEKEAYYLDQIALHGSGKAAERALGLGTDTVNKAVRRLKARAAKFHGYAPEASLNHPVAEGFQLHGYSHLTKTANGENIWLKTSAIREKHTQAIINAIEGIQPKQLDIPPPKLSGVDAQDIIPWLNIGDAHIGALAHESESGANFDIKLAIRELKQAAFDLIDTAPDTERMVINDCGDGTHYETFKAMTQASGHILDFDTRYPRMVEAYYAVMTAIIEKALSKARHVDVVINQGNHSESNDVTAAVALRHVYKNEPRVIVLRNDNPFIGYRMGNTFVLLHHGHKLKPEKLRAVMSNDYAQDWGEAKFRYMWGGHVHHNAVKELDGAKHESFNNLAPNDKYAHDGGWRSKQAMTMVKLSRKYGDVGREVMPVEKVWDAIRSVDPAHYVPSPKRAYTV